MSVPYVTSAELAVARDYLSADYSQLIPEYHRDLDDVVGFVAGLSTRQVISRINLIYAGGWAAFCHWHADEIADVRGLRCTALTPTTTKEN